MVTTDQALSDFALPSFDGRALARRAALPLLLGGGAVAAAMFAGRAGHAFVHAMTRAFGASGGWVIAGVFCECLSIAGYVWLLSLVAGRATRRIGVRESAQITLAGAAATRLLPTAGAGGAAVALWALRRAGLAPRAATQTLLSFLVLLYAVFLTAIVLAGAALAFGFVRAPGPIELSIVPAVAALSVIVLCLIVAFRRRTEADDQRGGRVRNTAAVLGGAVRDACALARRADVPLLGAIIYWTLDATVLWTALHAFGSPPSLPVLALAYFVGQAANTLPIPGSVSGGIAGVLIAFGVSPELALPAVLAYRAIAVWLPTLISLGFLRGLRATIARWKSEDVSHEVAVAQ